jgi:serine protease AprX
MAATPDRDRDGVYDDLEARLATLPAQSRVRAVVVLSSPATASRVEKLERRLGGFALGRRFSLVPAFSAALREDQVVALADLPEVDHVELDAPVYAAIDSAQQSFGVSAARLDAGVDGDGDGDPDTYTKDDLVAAIIDSGIDAGHRDLDDGKVIGWLDLVDGSDTPYDDLGHGTLVAGVLSGDGEGRPDGRYRGVAPGAGLVGVKVLDGQGRGTEADLIAGLQWVVAHKDEFGIEVVNLSVESPGCSNGADGMSLAVNAAAAAGLVVAAAAGNSGPGTCTVGSPGAAASAITVGAMADPGAVGYGFLQASFSSRGPTLDGRIKPDVSAPGVSITTALAGTSGGYTVQSGTSLASPFVAGVALLMRDADPSLTPQEIKDIVGATAVDWGRGGGNTVAGSTGADIDYGAGRLDAYAAIEAAAGHDIGSPPAGPAHELEEGALAGTGDVLEYPVAVADAAFPIAATLIRPSGSGAFRLRLLGPDGTPVASSASGGRQQALGYLPPAPGAYRLQVVSVAGAGDIFVDVSAGLEVTQTVAPANLTPPSIVGVARDGELLNGLDGDWTGAPAPILSRQWQRCDAAGDGCADIEGATGATYAVSPADVGTTLRVVVTAQNAAGAVSADSVPTPAIAALAPVNITTPTVLGLAQVGQRLVALDGAWAGTPPLGLSRRWQRCDGDGGACADIAGETNPAYLVRIADLGMRVRVVVTASNAGGGEEAASTATGEVGPMPAPRVTGASARRHGHRAVFKARTEQCDPCRVELWLKAHGRWRVVPMRPAASADPARAAWTVTIRRIPSGSRRWYVRATDLDTSRAARSPVEILTIT